LSFLCIDHLSKLSLASIANCEKDSIELGLWD